MAIRLAAVTSFVVFAVCLVAGAGNTFSTAVGRALVAMIATMGVGLIVGWMGQKMIDENIQQQVKSVPDVPAIPETKALTSDNKGAKSAAKKDEGKPPRRGR